MPHKKLSRLAPLLSVILPLTLTGCATTTGSGEPTTSRLTFCAGARPFLWSAKDTEKSIVQAKAHNRVGVDNCGWGSNK